MPKALDHTQQPAVHTDAKSGGCMPECCVGKRWLTAGTGPAQPPERWCYQTTVRTRLVEAVHEGEEPGHVVGQLLGEEVVRDRVRPPHRGRVLQVALRMRVESQVAEPASGPLSTHTPLGTWCNAAHDDAAWWRCSPACSTQAYPRCTAGRSMCTLRLTQQRKPAAVLQTDICSTLAAPLRTAATLAYGTFENVIQKTESARCRRGRTLPRPRHRKSTSTSHATACLQLQEGGVHGRALPRPAAEEGDALGVRPQPGVQPPEGALQPVLPLRQGPKVRRDRPVVVRNRAPLLVALNKVTGKIGCA